MNNPLPCLQQKYPQASAWSFGDSPEMADELAALVIAGIKTASCGSLQAYQQENDLPAVGDFSIILDGRDQPVAVIKTTALHIIRFCDVTSELASKEGEGDRSLAYWRHEHQAFFSREGSYTEQMELLFSEFQLVETL
ncbi:ASCH domain-containing protein [Erwiniaceae bacterium BAC15a-03b]|uniref:ASCH domain-containing protein n=1 Tax=Winslowiella arboricola TaxID=2978220 RepID=A0A9J6PMK1_9GAMM|nr:ASCH domain-containing protein [Winslowiella arboricola]MCU5772592.1 ASCH domain-containing protein [Winslowiella arboricola]MCU5778626.1 ASCH domain-containing protein [Winslowiella arboricola]